MGKKNKIRTPYTFTLKGITYEADRKRKTATAFAYTGSGRVVIPDAVLDNGISYQVLGMSYRRTDLNESITGIVIPDSIVKINSLAFLSLQGLTDIEIGNGAIEMDHSSFRFCQKIETVEVSEQNPSFCSSDGVLFNKDKTELIYCPSGRKGIYTVPDGVIKIRAFAFQSCSELTDVIISDTVTDIGCASFDSCCGLRNITIGNHVEKIEGIVFGGCRFTEVIIPDSVTEIGLWSFTDCQQLEKVMIGKNVAKIKKSIFRNCVNIKEIYVHADNRHYISEDGVLFNRNKTSLIYCVKTKHGVYSIPESVKRIEGRAFEHCAEITDIIISKSVKYIGLEAFVGCGNLSVITMLSPKPPLPDRLALDPNECIFDDTTHCELRIPKGSGDVYTDWANKYGFTFRKIDEFLNTPPKYSGA